MKDVIKTINLSELHAFPDNPFKVIENEELQLLVESIKQFGVISPLLVRPKDEGGYEIISGHRRVAACKQAGVDNIPAFIRNMSKDAAIIAVVDSNLQRENILPSEKAYAYKMKLEAIKHQGITSRQLGEKLSVAVISEDTKESERQIQRYIRLTKLIPQLLKLVDEYKIAFSPAVEISFLNEEEQINLLETIEIEDRTPSFSQAQRMKQLSLNGQLNMNMIFSIMSEEKPNEKEQIKFKTESIKSFFPKDYTSIQMQETIMKLLAEWQRKREQRNRDSR